MRALNHIFLRPIQTLLLAGAAACLLHGSAIAQSEVTPVTANESEEAAMVDAPMFKIGWPKFKMPEFQWKPSWGGGEETAPAQPSENPISGALDKVSSASKRAANSVRGAWDSTVTKISSFGESDTQRTASRDTPSFWSRVFGSGEPPRESQTVQEFLAQDRPGTTRR